jgi:hypothetical protein
MTLAFKAALPTTQKFVLVALCDSANDQGECYPSVSVLMEKCSLAERTVQEALTALVATGMVRREFRKGRSTVYWLDPRANCTPAPAAPPQVAHPTPAPRAPLPPQVAHPTPAGGAPITINEPSDEPSGKQKRKTADCPGDVDGQVFEDFKALRVAKRAPITKTALDGIRREADKAGLPMQAALEMACERGWAGFKAEWIKDRGGGSQVSRQEALEARNRAVVEDYFKGAI